MLIFLSFLTLVSSQSLEKNYCRKFKCAPVTVRMNTTTCIYSDLLYLTYYLKICPSTAPYCAPDFNTVANVTCSSTKANISYSSYPGEPCNVTTDCVFGTCLSGICFGANPQEACKSHGNCNPGLRCSGLKCVPLLKVGEKGCESDYDCEDSLGCNKNTTTGVCVPFFSLRNGAKISICNPAGQGGHSYLCDSGVCLGTSWRTAAGVCSEAPVSEHNNPKECTYSSDCKGYTEVFNYTGKCVCGVNPYATSYCQPFFGDLQGAKYLKALKGFFRGGLVKQCNTERRYSKECWDLFTYSDLYKSLFKAQYEFENFPKLQNNDLCIQSIYFKDYYNPTYSGSLNTLVAISLFLAL